MRKWLTYQHILYMFMYVNRILTKSVLMKNTFDIAPFFLRFLRRWGFYLGDGNSIEKNLSSLFLYLFS